MHEERFSRCHTNLGCGRMLELVVSFGAVALLLAAIGGTLLAVLWLIRWVLGPMLVVSERSPRPTQYRITDLACLVLQLSATSFLLTSLFQLFGGVDAPAMLVVPLWLYFAVSWWAGVQQLTAAGVAGYLRRTVFLLTVGTVAYLGSAVGPALAFVAVLSLAIGGGEASRASAVLAGLAMATTAALVAAAMISRWVYAGREATQSNVVTPFSPETSSLTIL